MENLIVCDTFLLIASVNFFLLKLIPKEKLDNGNLMVT
jgi:hypothetical protein